MAEERLIDDDKDRKYKIRKNADGEDELVIDDTPDDEEESDIPVFNVPVYEEDDEEAAVLTPEQQAERERIKQEEEKARADKCEKLMQKAREKLSEEDFEGAIYAISQAEELAENNSEFYCLKLKAYSRNFTDFLALDKCAEAADGVREFANGEQKAELKNLASGFEARIAQTSELTSKLKEENESKKEERRALFVQSRNKAKRNLICAAAPFAVLLILAIVFSTMIFAAENGTFLILTIVFAALALIALVATLFTLNLFWSAQRTVKLNEKDTSTKLGREYLAKSEELELLNRIYSAFNDDIS